MRVKRKIKPIPAKQSASKLVAAPKMNRSRRRLRPTVIRTGRPGTLALTNEKIDAILFG